ncbi:hypothetical protein EV361DRAFT_869150, partial [Lentinula raphanica]
VENELSKPQVENELSIPGSCPPDCTPDCTPEGDTDPISRRSWSHYIRSTGGKFLLDVQIPKILLNAGALSYLLSTTRLLWKFAKEFGSQPHFLAVGFAVPSVAVFVFVQHTWPRQAPAEETRILQAAVEVTVLAGAFVCVFIVWSVLSVVGDLSAAFILALAIDTTSSHATDDTDESIAEGGPPVVENVGDYLLLLEALRTVALVAPSMQLK